MTEGHTPSGLDTLLGATPRRVARHWLSLLVLTLAGLGAAAFFVRFVTGEDSPYYSAAVERGDLVPMVAQKGELHAAGEFVISAPRAGRITWISPKSTGAVKKGELLARIDLVGAKDAIGIEESDVTAAHAALAAAQISAQEAAARLGRFEGVWRRSGGRAPALNEMEAARASARRTSLAVDSARAQATAARLRLKGKRADVAPSELRAPDDAVILDRLASHGQAVDERQPLFTLSRTQGPLVIEVPIPMPPFGPPPTGAPAQVRLDALPDAPQAATLAQLRPASRSQPGLAIARFAIAQADPRLRPGMPATVEMLLPPRRGVLLVPDAALAFDPGAAAGRQPPSVYVLSKGGEPRRVNVVVGASDGQHTEVFGAGLAPGDQVIIGWRAPTAASSGTRPGS